MRSFNLLIILLLLVFISCEAKYKSGPLVVRNNADTGISVWYNSWQKESFPAHHYPDTMLPADIPANIHGFGAWNEGMISEENPDWGEIFYILPKNKLSVYFFKHQINNEAEWDSIRVGYHFVRLDVSRSELIEKEYVVEFP